MEDKASSERKIFIHPLAIVSIADHFTGIQAGAAVKPPGSKVIGLLWGKQDGLEVDIMDAVELPYHTEPAIEAEQLNAQRDLYTTVYQDRELLGWYSVGVEAQESEMMIHRQMTQFNESPFFLLMHAKPDPEAKELPISLYESEMHVVNETPTMLFVSLKFQLETLQAERITMERVAKEKAAEGVSSMDVHVQSVHGSLRTLEARTSVLIRLLEETKAGSIPPDHRLLRQVSSICNQLPAVDAEELHGEFLTDFNDTMMVNYMASITKGAAAINELSDKFGLISASNKTRF